MIKFVFFQLFVVNILFAQWDFLDKIKIDQDIKVLAIHLSDDGTVLVVRDEKRLSIWVLNQDGVWVQEDFVLENRVGDLSAVFLALSADGLQFVTDANDQDMHACIFADCAWHQNSIDCAEDLRHGDRITIARFSNDGKKLVTGSRNGECKIWQSEKRGLKLTHTIEVSLDEGDLNGIIALSLDKSGKVVGIIDQRGRASIWAIENNRYQLKQQLDQNEDYCSLSFSLDAKYLVTGTQHTFTLCMWENENDVWKKSCLSQRFHSAIDYLHFFNDGKRFLCHSDVSIERADTIDTFVLKSSAEWEKDNDFFATHSKYDELDPIYFVAVSSEGNLLALVKEHGILTYTFNTISKIKAANSEFLVKRKIEQIPPPTLSKRFKGN